MRTNGLHRKHPEQRCLAGPISPGTGNYKSHTSHTARERCLTIGVWAVKYIHTV
jgi:hypothetical protein